MSKMDNLRAMREARYAESQVRARANAAAPASSAKARIATARPERAPILAIAPDPMEPEQAPAQCGHRNMGGRTCTREAGHTAKSHRYS